MKTNFRQFSPKGLIAVMALSLVFQFLMPVGTIFAEENLPADEITTTTPEAIIITGNAGSGSDTNSTVNYNETETPISGFDPCAPDDTGCITETAVTNENEATVITEIEVTAETGENVISDNEGDATIITGDAFAQTNISNLINTNIVGDGEFIAIDIYGETTGDIDLSSGSLAGEDEILGESGIIDNSLEVGNTNEGTVINEVEIEVNTGENEVSSNSGDAVIITGDAVAQVNISNIVNTNIVGNNWIFAVLNIFGDWEGDIVIPSDYSEFKKNFKNLIIQSDGNGETEIEVINNNEATVENNIEAQANTGGNEAENNEGDSTITTGDAASVVNVVNDINNNIFGNGWNFIKINIFGNWDGHIYGLPADATYAETEDGIIIYRLGGEESSESETQDLLPTDNSTSVENENEATVINNVSVESNTGDNEANENDEASIKTGDAASLVNISNQVNTNLTGDDWIYNLINVFGNWLGDLAFGRPDLWVTESVEVERNPSGIGNFIKYNFEFGNNGDGLASGVILHDFLAESVLRITNFSNGQKAEEGITWSLGELKPGETGSLTYEVQLTDALGVGQWQIGNNVMIYSVEEDKNPNDNVSGGTFIAFNAGNLSAAINNSGQSVWPPNLVIFKSHNTKSVVNIGDVVSYKLIIMNTGGLPTYNTLVQDILTDSLNRQVAINTWDLGVVMPKEEITIEYDVEILANAVSGIYINTASVEGWDNNFGEWQFKEAKAKIEVNGLTLEEVAALEQNNQPEEPKEEQLTPELPLAPEIPAPVIEKPVVKNENITREQKTSITEEDIENIKSQLNGMVLGVDNTEIPENPAENQTPNWLALLASLFLFASSATLRFIGIY